MVKRRRSKRLILKYTNVENCQNELQRVQEFWQELLRRIQIKTPDKSMDLLVNGWLPYQTIACRLWARSAFINQEELMALETNCRML